MSAKGKEEGDAMQVDEGTTLPSDPKFLDSLPSDLRAIADATLAAPPDQDAATKLEKLEVQLRRVVLRRIRESQQQADLGNCWKASLHLCLHFVVMSEDTKDARYKGLSPRKIPFVLLEDIFDCLPVDKCRSFWEDFVLGSYETIFGKRIWTPKPEQHPCWLTFLKITNKLIRRLPPKDAASIMLTLCRVYPLAEKSGMRPLNSHNADNVTTFEDSDEYEEEQARLPAESKTDEEGSASDYNFYESFWKFQEDLNDPHCANADTFYRRLDRLKNVVTALESHSVSAQKATCERGVKYLTSSHLLSYQLSDPEFRIYILTQILIMCQHLSSAKPPFRLRLVEWENRSKVLLKNVGPEGVQHLALLESVFGRSEETWRQWKKDKDREDLDKKQSEPLVGTKRRHTDEGTKGGVAAAEEDEASQALTQGVLNVSELAAASKQMRKVLPSMDTHLAEYVEALDPEAGIEAEYHPKNDKLFAWRALRVMSREHLGFMQRVHVDGDFEGLVRHIYKEEQDMDIPGEYPEYETEDFEEKEEDEFEEKVEEENIKAEAESAGDEAMEDIVENGSPKPESSVERVEAGVGSLDKKPESDPKANGAAKMEVDTEEGTKDEKSEAKSLETPTKGSQLEAKPVETVNGAVSTPKTTEKVEEPQRRDSQGDRPRLKFTPPPNKRQSAEAQDDRPLPSENGQKHRVDDPVDASSGGRRNRGGPGRGEARSRGPSNDRGRNQPSRADRGPPPGREDRGGAGRERSGRRSPAGMDDRAPPSNRGGGGDRVSPPRRDDRGPPPPRREDHWVPPPGRGGGHGDNRRGGGGRGGGGGHRGDDRGPPHDRWEDQRRPRRDDRGEDRREVDDRRGPRRRRS